MNRIYFVRHGQSEANASRVFSSLPGKYPLTSKGTQQAAATGEYFKNLEIDEVYSSNLLRAFQTASIISDSHDIIPSQFEEFAEIDTGDLEDKPIDNESIAFYYGIVSSWIDGNHSATFPGGENFITLINRMKYGLRRVCAGKRNKNIIVVAHGGLLTLTLPHLFSNVTAEEFLGIESNRYVENCSITEAEIEFSGGNLNCNLLKWGDASHISSEIREIRSKV